MIGCTVSTIGGLVKGVQRAAGMQYQCTQLYTTHSRSWDVGAADINFRQEALKYPVYLISHVPLIVNIVSNNALVKDKSKARLRQEIIRASQYGIKELVFHPGNTLDGDTYRGLIEAVQVIDDVSDLCLRCGLVLAVETMSGQGTEIGANIEEIAFILKHVKEHSCLKVCIDTAHLYASGYDISNKHSWRRFLDFFDKEIGLEKIAAIHLNNTKTECGSMIDRHSSIFDGNIKLETFEDIVLDARFDSVPIVIETPAKDTSGPEQVNYLKKIMKGKEKE